ncbi:MAG: DEAD/DEAH box helicase [Clostridia bacterium]|nr:DEAD/DEAH box helicase [Clostridia bacterium]
MIGIESLYGVGPERARSFAKKGIKTAEDLLYYLPRGHEDRTKFYDIHDCPVGDFVCIKAKVYSPVRETRIKKNFNIYSMVVFDDSGAMNVVWYNNRFVKNAFRTGEEVLFYGKVAISRGKKELLNPIYEKAENQRFIGKIVPVYPLFGNITQKVIAGLVEQAMEKSGEFSEYIPKAICEKYEICDINFAMRNIHFPADFESYSIARKRFVFEELLFLQLALSGKRNDNEKRERTPFSDTDCVGEFIDSLPYELTGAQKRVIDEICKNFKSKTPMNRLVQGDVGSGKTVVAAAGMYVASKNGYQSAIMAPTEILATQHFNTFSELFRNCNIKCVLLTSSTKNKKAVYEEIKDGKYDIIIGTNAIIQKDVEYKNLGFVVADEQHRFGVSQRARLTAKGENPNTLIMTATPIPRTRSLIRYDDLDVSIIDELPP